MWKKKIQLIDWSGPKMEIHPLVQHKNKVFGSLGFETFSSDKFPLIQNVGFDFYLKFTLL